MRVVANIAISTAAQMVYDIEMKGVGVFTGRQYTQMVQDFVTTAN